MMERKEKEDTAANTPVEDATAEEKEEVKVEGGEPSTTTKEDKAEKKE